VSRYYDDRWPPYVSAAERRLKAAREAQKLRKKGHPVSPVTIEGRKIATTFWGKAWCDNMEGYHDFESRLPRGRTYVRNGSVLDLQITPRKVTALVSGSEIYKVAIDIAELPKKKWASIRADCAGGIDSLIELLQGKLSKGVMERLCRQDAGLFPKPAEIRFSCSCPDYASMCKHVAAVLYGVGARLDHKPELLFRLRAVDETDLIGQIDAALPMSGKDVAFGKVLDGGDLSALFGLEMAAAPANGAAADSPRPTRSRRAASAPKRTPVAVKAAASRKRGASAVKVLADEARRARASKRRRRRGEPGAMEADA